MARPTPMLVSQLQRAGNSRLGKEFSARCVSGERGRERHSPIREGREGRLHHGLSVPDFSFSGIRDLS